MDLEPVNGQQFLGEIDVMFIPLLAFDINGNRIGYGKGFYDKFLSNQNNQIVKIGLSFFNPENKIQKDAHDKTLDFCVTPNKTFSF